MVLNQNTDPGKKAAAGKISSYTFELDRVKVFWIFLLTVLVLTFVFVFGYWTGQHNSTDYTTFAKDVSHPKELSSENAEIRELLGETSDKKATSLSEGDKTDAPSLKKSVQAGLNEDQTSKEDLSEDVADEPVKIKKKSSAKTKKTALKSEAKGRKYVIQFASFKEKNKAYQLKEKIQDAGMKSYVVKEGSIYKVRIGNFENYDKAAHSLSKAMKDFKVKDAYIYTTGSNKKA